MVYIFTVISDEVEDFVREILPEHFIVRISWVFGINGKNFIKTMINVGKTHDEVRVVNDQIGTPTYTYDIIILKIIQLFGLVQTLQVMEIECVAFGTIKNSILNLY